MSGPILESLSHKAQVAREKGGQISSLRPLPEARGPGPSIPRASLRAEPESSKEREGAYGRMGRSSGEALSWHGVS